MTSPPYFALRSYQDGGKAYDGQLGAEATPAEFIDALLAATREMVRVLKPSGSIWINLGDKYSGAQAQNVKARAGDDSAAMYRRTDPRRIGIPAKSLMGIPWRYAIRCIDELGLILRAEVIWSKPNGLPESVTDRVCRKHEQWFHFTVEPRYFSAVDEIREEYLAPPAKAQKSKYTSAGQSKNPTVMLAHNIEHNTLGKLPGSVWTITPEPLTVPDHLGIDHFAAFPTEWPRRIILGWTPTGICTTCGQGRQPVTEKSEPRPVRGNYIGPIGSDNYLDGRSGQIHDAQHNMVRTDKGWSFLTRDTSIAGYACDCPTPDAPTRPAVVLDPFCGTGTTIAVAKALGRHGIGTDLSADYLRLADWRTNGPGYRTIYNKVHNITTTPDTTIDGQLAMFDTTGAC